MSAAGTISTREDASPPGGGLAALRRRIVSIPLLALALAALLVGMPLWLPLAMLVDLARGRRAWPTARCGIFLTWYALCEVWGVLAATRLWLTAALFGMERAAWLSAHYKLQQRWCEALLAGTFKLYRMRVVVEGAERLEGAPALVLMRHTSVGDGMLAIRFLGVGAGYRLRFALKRELLWDPCLDVVGNRLPNAFVRRDGSDSAREVARVAALADGLGPREGVLLFPEGTRFTPERRERALARLLREGRNALYEVARNYRRSLPPRPGGALSVLARNPDLDVILCAHVGLEEGTRLTSFLSGALLDVGVRVRFWRFPASEIPRDDEGRLSWLYARWAELDLWVDAELSDLEEPRARLAGRQGA